MWPELRSTVLYPPAPQRAVSVRRVRRLRVHGVAADAAQARRPADRRAGARRGGRHPRRHRRRGRGARRARSAGGTTRASAIACTFAGRLTDEQLVDHLARCRAVCFPPFEEDYGFVTVEAFASRKAVITCRDSGGPAELVERRRQRLRLRARRRQALAAAMRRLAERSGRARRAAWAPAAFDGVRAPSCTWCRDCGAGLSLIELRLSNSSIQAHVLQIAARNADRQEGHQGDHRLRADRGRRPRDGRAVGRQGQLGAAARSSTCCASARRSRSRSSRSTSTPATRATSTT